MNVKLWKCGLPAILLFLASTKGQADPTTDIAKLEGFWVRETATSIWIKHYFGNRFAAIAVQKGTPKLTHYRSGTLLKKNGELTEETKYFTTSWYQFRKAPALNFSFVIDDDTLAMQARGDESRQLWDRYAGNKNLQAGTRITFSEKPTELDGLWFSDAGGDTIGLKVYHQGQVLFSRLSKGEPKIASEPMLGIYAFDGKICTQRFQYATNKGFLKGDIEIPLKFTSKNEFEQLNPDGITTIWKRVSETSIPD